MPIINTNKNTNDSDNYYDSNDTYDDTYDNIDQLLEENEELTIDDNEIDDSNIFNNIIDNTNEYSKVYIVDAYKFVKYIHNWEYNRKLNDNHVNDLYNDQLHNVINGVIKPYFFGNFIVGCYKNNDNNIYRLIDGQHRIACILKLQENNIPSFNIRVEIITVNNEIKLVSLFKMINKSLPIKLSDFPEAKLLETISHIKKLYPQYFSKSDYPVLPNINEKILLNELTKHKIFDTYPITPIELVNIIRKINTVKSNEYKNKFKVKNSNKEFNKMKKIYEKAILKGDFVLTVDYKFDWIIDLINILEQKYYN